MQTDRLTSGASLPPLLILWRRWRTVTGGLWGESEAGRAGGGRGWVRGWPSDEHAGRGGQGAEITWAEPARRRQRCTVGAQHRERQRAGGLSLPQSISGPRDCSQSQSQSQRLRQRALSCPQQSQRLPCGPRPGRATTETLPLAHHRRNPRRPASHHRPPPTSAAVHCKHARCCWRAAGPPPTLSCPCNRHCPDCVGPRHSRRPNPHTTLAATRLRTTTTSTTSSSPLSPSCPPPRPLAAPPPRPLAPPLRLGRYTAGHARVRDLRILA